MTNQELLYSYAMFLHSNNPTSIQVGVGEDQYFANLITANQISENDEYINLSVDPRDQSTVDKAGNDYVLKDMNIIVTFKINKSNPINDPREVLFQKFIEGMDSKLNNKFSIYDLSDAVPVETNKSVRILYGDIKSGITVYNDETTKTKFWVVPIRHTN